MKSRDPSFKMVAYIFDTNCSFSIFFGSLTPFFFLLFRKPKYCCLYSVLLALKHLSDHVLTFAL